MEKNNIDPIDVSVCISVHNTAKYLPRCLDSVCAQTLQSLEIVLVNNGSTDNSEDIMRDYEARHPERKFVIISQEDRSLAGGRQTGVNHASGEYVVFLDADDYVASSAYEKMLNTIKKEEADIVEVDTLRGDKIIANDICQGLCSSSDVLISYFEGKIYPMIWLRMYKRDLFSKQVFPDIYINNEDIFAFPCLLAKARTIFFLHEQLHFYSIDNEGSVMINMKKRDNSERDYNRRLKTLKADAFIKEFYKDEVVDQKIMMYLNHHYAKQLFFFVTYKDNIPFAKKINDIVFNLDFKDYNQLNTYIKDSIIPDTILRKFLGICGLKATYILKKLMF